MLKAVTHQIRPRLALLNSRRLPCHNRLSNRSMHIAVQPTQHELQPADRKPQVVILTGPTAVGKTATSLQLAQHVNGEIISADSVQIYRGLDIGSAKLPEAERQGIPHHLIDIADASEEFSAGHFFQRARSVTKDILQRGKVPIVVGGTGFYLRWYIYGKPNTPVSNEQLAAEAQKQLDEAWQQAASEAGRQLTPEEKWEAGTQLVTALGDPESADQLKEVPNNYYRMLRVIEIVLTTGKPRSALNLDETAPLEYDFRCFFLDRPRVELYNRIDLRCEEMLRDGLLQECLDLMRRGFQPDSGMATRAIGYRQGLEALQRWQDDPSSLAPDSMVQLLADVQQASRNYCHRQLKWARGVELFQWLDASQPAANLVSTIVESLQGRPHSGNSQGRGLLTKEESKGMRAYKPAVQLFNDQNLVQSLCATVATELSKPDI